MVIAKVIGGLGNQLFQYATGRAVAEANRTRLKLDISAFSGYRLRSFRLQHFALNADVLDIDEAQQLSSLIRCQRGPRRGLASLLGRPAVALIAERAFHFEPDILRARAPCYLDGYWQSPKYFSGIANTIRSELTVRGPLTGKNKQGAERIESSLAVSLHVRRGDYVHIESTRRYHGVCPPAYYYAAEELLRARLGQFTFFIFSDDPGWAEANLRFRSPAIFISHNGAEEDYEDLRLMALCKHHVTANSTFSWWGAWLCTYPDKIVIAPRNWFGEAPHQTDDLIPETWIRI